MENTKDTTKKVLEVINLIMPDTKLRNLVAFLYTNNEAVEREIKKTIPGAPGWHGG